MVTREGHQIITIRIKLWGIVQGVGFRPFVTRLADSLKIKGEVRNLGGLVDIVATSSKANLDTFIYDLRDKKPLPAEVVHIKVEELPFQQFKEFLILNSGEGDDEAAMIPADLSVCSHCLSEMKDENNPRYRHPFISCMECGPRYSIIDRIPYDRDNTAMIDFPMCSFCESEYTDRNDRRYHAQTISCHDCGPYLIYKGTGNKGQGTGAAKQRGGVDSGEEVRDHRSVFYKEEALNEAIKSLKSGGIVSVKGIGGYHLACSPFNADTVNNLRKFKNREEKPFAVMFKDIAEVQKYCIINDSESKLLDSSAKPIVILERKPSDIVEEVYRTSRFMGAFLPSTPVQMLLLEECGPLIMTSANLSDKPIIKDDDEMLKIEDTRLSGVLYNKRDIRVRLDDSVVKVIDDQPQMTRRSKGYTPVPIYIANTSLNKQKMVIAMGGQLKADFCLTKGPFAYVSQYFGDMDNQETLGIYRENIDRMQELFRIQPELAVCDLHPLYISSQFAEEMALPVLKVQHHHAHAASVIAEHGIADPVIAVTFDGTGYGTDGAIWGGEFLVCHGKDYQRTAHLEYVNMIGGDSSMKEGWKSALCYLHAADLASYIKDERYAIIKKALDMGVNTIKSSSMGRLFDAVSSFLGIQHINRYEGECAIMLENAAVEAIRNNERPHPMDFDIKEEQKLIISSGSLFKQLAMGMDQGVSALSLSLGFHKAVAGMILKICIDIRKKQNINKVILSGGVFQNSLLMEECLGLLRNSGFIPYVNTSVPPNDGGICLGQAYIGMKYLEEIREQRVEIRD